MQLETFFSVSQQTVQFFLSIVIGAGLGVVYDVFRVLRIVFPLAKKKGAVFAADTVFMAICGIAVFFFSAVFCRGQVRFFCIIGVLLGFVLYILTLGSFVAGVFRAIASAVAGVLQKVYSVLFVPVVEFVKYFCIKNNNVFVHSYENEEN